MLQAPGDVATSDVDLALATESVVLGFNVKVPGPVKTYAEKNHVEIRVYRVIYDMIDGLRNAMEGLLEPAEVKSALAIPDANFLFHLQNLMYIIPEISFFLFCVLLAVLN